MFDSDHEFDHEQLSLHARYILGFAQRHCSDYRLHLREEVWP